MTMADILIPEDILEVKGDEVELEKLSNIERDSFEEEYSEVEGEVARDDAESRRKARKAKIKAKKRRFALHSLRNPSYKNPYRSRKHWDAPKCSECVLDRNFDRRNANSKRYKRERVEVPSKEALGEMEVAEA